METMYWRGAAEDEAMQDEHGFIWLAMLDAVDIELAGGRVLDAGCNRGGFLRLLADRHAIAEGYGYDPASGAVDDARGLSDGRPLHFEVSSTVPTGWSGFDAAFSHEVLYLIDDLPAHAAAIATALAPGAPYFAVMGMHSGSPLMSAWHKAHVEEMHLPTMYSLDGVVDVFEAAGFEARVGQLPLRFIPVTAHRSRHDRTDDLSDWIDYYTRDKVLFRFAAPSER